MQCRALLPLSVAVQTFSLPRLVRDAFSRLDELGLAVIAQGVAPGCGILASRGRSRASPHLACRDSHRHLHPQISARVPIAENGAWRWRGRHSVGVVKPIEEINGIGHTGG